MPPTPHNPKPFLAHSKKLVALYIDSIPQLFVSITRKLNYYLYYLLSTTTYNSEPNRYSLPTPRPLGMFVLALSKWRGIEPPSGGYEL